MKIKNYKISNIYKYGEIRRKWQPQEVASIVAKLLKKFQKDTDEHTKHSNMILMLGLNPKMSFAECAKVCNTKYEKCRACTRDGLTCEETHTKCIPCDVRCRECKLKGLACDPTHKYVVRCSDCQEIQKCDRQKLPLFAIVYGTAIDKLYSEMGNKFLEEVYPSQVDKEYKFQTIATHPDAAPLRDEFIAAHLVLTHVMYTTVALTKAECVADKSAVADE